MHLVARCRRALGRRRARVIRVAGVGVAPVLAVAGDPFPLSEEAARLRGADRPAARNRMPLRRRLLQGGDRKPFALVTEVDVRAGDQVPRVIDVVPVRRYSKLRMQAHPERRRHARPPESSPLFDQTLRVGAALGHGVRGPDQRAARRAGARRRRRARYARRQLRRPSSWLGRRLMPPSRRPAAGAAACRGGPGRAPRPGDSHGHPARRPAA